MIKTNSKPVALIQSKSRYPMCGTAITKLETHLPKTTEIISLIYLYDISRQNILQSKYIKL